MVSSFDELFIEVKKAGSLKRLIVNDKIKYLKLAGPINGTDFNTIRKLKKLTYLDLSNCQFVGGGRSYEINDSLLSGEILP